MNSGKSNSLALVLVAIFVIGAGYFVMSGGAAPVVNLPAIEDTKDDTPVINAADQLSSPGQDPERIDIERTSTDINNSDIDNLFADVIGGTVSGKVVDENGKSVVGATVSLNQRYNAGELMRGYQSGARFKTTSDRNGEFIFAGLAVGINMNMWVNHSDFAPKQGAPFAALKNESQTLPPTILRAGYVVSGKVTDRGSNPLQATVELNMQPSDAFRQGSAEEIRTQDIASGRSVTVMADGNGDFHVDKLAEGIWILRASYDGFATAEIRPIMLLKGKNADRQKVVLPDEFTIGGVVLDEQQMPIADAVIGVARTSPRPTLTGSATTNRQGEFKVRGLQEGSYGLSVQAPGYTNGRSGRVNAGEDNVQIVMQVKGSVSGRVSGSAGQSISSFQLEILRTRRGNQQYGLTGQRYKFTDTDGTFDLPDLAPGSYILLGRANGYAPTYSSSFSVGRTKVEGIDILLEAGGVIKGTIVDGEGHPVSGAVISVHGEDFTLDSNDTLFGSAIGDPNNMPQVKTRSNSKGEFTLDNVVPSALTLQIEHSEYLDELVVSMASSGTTTNVGRIVIYQGGSVHGVVSDKNGDPLAGGTVTMTTPNGNFFHRTITIDAKGRYRISGLAAGTYSVSPIAASIDGLWAGLDTTDDKSIYVNVGQDLELNLETSK
ncbi:MAG: carboxypeptidase-like regulatory domain-containing protein [Planctomycetota bacterium]|nr:carboxypeptidase-like regulatory domain-containing protein [Planctomycetota bacterium]